MSRSHGPEVPIACLPAAVLLLGRRDGLDGRADEWERCNGLDEGEIRLSFLSRNPEGSLGCISVDSHVL